MTSEALQAVVRSVRPALRSATTTEEEREQFVYDLVREVYDFVKLEVHGPDVDADERMRIGAVANAALPRV